MSLRQSSPARTGLYMFLGALVLGAVIFTVFGFLAGAFSSEEGVIAALTASPFGYIALFGATLILAAPLIGLTVWAYDRAIKSVIEREQQKRKG